MRSACNILFSIFLIIGLLTLPTYGDGVHVGRSVGGQLLIEIEPNFAGVNVILPTIPGGLFEGWTGTDPGFINQLDAETPPDFLPLEIGAMIWLEAVSLDPAFRVIGTDFRIVQIPGDDTFLGDSTFIFDTHPTYHINSADPAFDPGQTLWQGTFIIRDDGATGFLPSDPFTLRFSNVPFSVGDMNCDGLLDGLDIEPFVQALLDPAGFSAAFPACNLNNADMNADGVLDASDVAPFVGVLI